MQIIVACSLQGDGSGCLIEGGCLMQGRYNYTVLTVFLKTTVQCSLIYASCLEMNLRTFPCFAFSYLCNVFLKSLKKTTLPYTKLSIIILIVLLIFYLFTSFLEVGDHYVFLFIMLIMLILHLLY